MGIGDWGLGIGDWGLGPIPSPQSPIPMISYLYKILKIIIILKIFKFYHQLSLNKIINLYK